MDTDVTDAHTHNLEHDDNNNTIQTSVWLTRHFQLQHQVLKMTCASLSANQLLHTHAHTHARSHVLAHTNTHTRTVIFKDEWVSGVFAAAGRGLTERFSLSLTLDPLYPGLPRPVGG